MSIITRIRRNEYFKSAIVIVVIVAIVLGFFFGLQLALGTSVPVRVVESGSMCVPYDGACNGWSHPFAHTLHVGDIIVIQKVNPADLNSNYPNSDIIVYENPTDPTSTPIVHRIVDNKRSQRHNLLPNKRRRQQRRQVASYPFTSRIRFPHSLEHGTGRSSRPCDR